MDSVLQPLGIGLPNPDDLVIAISELSVVDDHGIVVLRLVDGTLYTVGVYASAVTH